MVTGNKELLANHGAELFAAADAAGVDLLFEAAVAGGIPLIRPLRESLAGEHITRVMGIVNGTTNYILTRMTEEGEPYAEALAEAQSLGLRRARPDRRRRGLRRRRQGGDHRHHRVRRAGRGRRRRTTRASPAITAADIAFAERLGYVIKLLAIAERFEGADGPEIGVRVHPAMVPTAHPLASVRDSFNAVFVEGDGGRRPHVLRAGRGRRPDRQRGARRPDRRGRPTCARAPTPRSARWRRARIRPDRRDHLVVLPEPRRRGPARRAAAVAEVFERHGVSIRSMEQEGLGDEARLIFITHVAREADVQATLRDLRDLDAVDRVGSVLRVVDGD